MPGPEGMLPGNHLPVSMLGVAERWSNGSRHAVQKAACDDKHVSRKIPVSKLVCHEQRQ